MATTMDKKIILQGSPYLWLLEVDPTKIIAADPDALPTPITRDVEGAIIDTYQFDNLGDCTYTLKSAASATTSDSITITRSDHTEIHFPKATFTINGVDETEITDVATATDATGLGEIKAIINEAPLTAGVTSWSDFMNKIRTKQDSLWLIIIGTGYSYYDFNTASVRRPDGFMFMFGKISGDLTWTAGASPSTLDLTFIAYKGTGFVEGDLQEIGTILTGEGKAITAITPILLKRASEVGNIAIAPTKLTSANALLLIAGNPVIDDCITVT